MKEKRHITITNHPGFSMPFPGQILNIMKKQKTLGKRFSTLLDYCITRRSYLIESGLSQRPESHMRGMMDRFRPYQKQNWTDEGAARFLKKHFYEIRQMIPARETKTMQELENLWMAAKVINLKKQKSCKSYSGLQTSLSLR